MCSERKRNAKTRKKKNVCCFGTYTLVVNVTRRLFFFFSFSFFFFLIEDFVFSSRSTHSVARFNCYDRLERCSWLIILPGMHTKVDSALAAHSYMRYIVKTGNIISGFYSTLNLKSWLPLGFKNSLFSLSSPGHLMLNWRCLCHRVCLLVDERFPRMAF